MKQTHPVSPKKSAAGKPLHKDLSFWIVAVTLVGAATGIQLYFGLPWFSQKYLQAHHAPRSVRNMNAGGTIISQTPNADTKKGSQTP